MSQNDQYYSLFIKEAGFENTKGICVRLTIGTDLTVNSILKMAQRTSCTKVEYAVGLTYFKSQTGIPCKHEASLKRFIPKAYLLLSSFLSFSYFLIHWLSMPILLSSNGPRADEIILFLVSTNT